MASSRHAFTLIELSIVLVIIGLIIGGILVGEDLIESARQRKFISEVDQIKASVNVFKVKYNYWPGDFPQATQVFTDPAVVNGTGDGVVWYMANHLLVGGVEKFQFWLHMSLDGIFPGKFTGQETGAGPSYINLAIDVPMSKAYPEAGFWVEGAV